MISTLTLPNVATLDHSYIDEEGRIKGRSYTASFLITGPVDDDYEKVVANVSKLSSLIQNVLYDRDYGLNHRLWIGPGFKSFVPTQTILSPFAELYLPDDSTYLFHGDEHLSPVFSEPLVADHVKKSLLNLFGLDLEVTCYLNSTPNFIQEGGVYNTFSYVHGLRDSTSYGRQSLVNGCTGYLQLIPSSDFIRPSANPVQSTYASSHLSPICSEICKDLDNTILMFADNIVVQTGETTCVGYHSRSRGPMSGTFTHDDEQKVLIMETETTIEHLAEYINAKYGEILKEAGVAKFIVSSGLLNGVLFEVN